MQTQPWLPYRTVYPPPEHTACDDLRVFSGLSAPHSSPRDILVLVPPTGREGDRRFPVLYMQDGRSLFDPGTSLARNPVVAIAIVHAAPPVGWGSK